MNKAEQVLRTYIDFEDANGSEPITLLPLTVIDAMEEYATQCQEDMADKIEQAIEYGYQLRCNHKPINSGIDWVKEFNLINKQDNEK